MKLFVVILFLGSALAATDFEKECVPKKDTGLCKGMLVRWWFNTESGKCELFFYSGCGGNDNRYEFVEECEAHCSRINTNGREDETDDAYIRISANQKKASAASVCRRPFYPGLCLGYFPRFYYDQVNKACRPFIYGGCQSNGNNFVSLEECMRVCRSV